MPDLIRMFYFGPWDGAGHYFFDESGRSIFERKIPDFPFGHYGDDRVGIDCRLQPGCYRDEHRRWRRDYSKEIEGHAAIHYVKGWTAISFWDRSVDKRGACNSTYLAEGFFTFDQMVEMAKSRFAHRWNKMDFDVVLVEECEAESAQ